jgi:hypothetical protein
LAIPTGKLLMRLFTVSHTQAAPETKPENFGPADVVVAENEHDHVERRHKVFQPAQHDHARSLLERAVVVTDRRARRRPVRKRAGSQASSARLSVSIASRSIGGWNWVAGPS